MAWFQRNPSSVGARIRTPRVRATRPAAARQARGALQTPRTRWPWLAAAIGAVTAVVVWAPASWLADAVTLGSQERVILAEAQGTIWNGSAVAVLTGGAGSRDARALPGRLGWSIRPTLSAGAGLRIHLTHACCLANAVGVSLRPGWQSVEVSVQPAVDGPAPWGHWPAAVLTGLGTPWNTLQPGGTVRLSSRSLVMQWTQGRFSLQGEASLELLDFSSRLTTLPTLGTYRATLAADPAQAGTAQVSLTTVDGALRLNGQGTWSASGLRFRGEASAEPDDQTALNNLLNIIGRRQGTRSLISIG